MNNICPRVYCLLVAAGLLLGECRGLAEETTTASFVPIPSTGEVSFQPTPAERDVPERFRLPAHRFPFQCEPLRQSDGVRVFHVTFPSPVQTDVPENNTVHGTYFQPEGAGPFPGCVVLHILGGDFPLSEMVAHSLASRKVAALFLRMPYYGERRSKTSPRQMISRDPNEAAAAMTQAVLDIRRAAAWLGSRPEVDPERLGITGISLGGIMSALSAAAEPRFRKVAMYLAGGNLGQAIWDLPHRDAEAFRRNWLAKAGTRESFIATLSPVDPCTYAGCLKDRDVLMVNARHDEVIPMTSTLALWEAAGRTPRLIWLDAGHITAAFYILGEIGRMQQFFTDGNWPARDTPK